MIGQPAHRRLLSAWIVVLTAALPLTLSVVDAGEKMTATHVESHHEPGQCFYHHDHAACVQLLRNAGEPAASGPVSMDAFQVWVSVTSQPERTRQRNAALLSTLGPRAPPA